MEYQWHTFGSHLGFTQSELAKLQADFGGADSVNKVERRFAWVLDNWRRGDPSYHNKSALVEALTGIERAGLASYIDEKFSGERT